MAKNDRLTDAERAFIHAAGFQAGIVPIEVHTHDMRRALAGLPDEEARKLKRKFRKLWRKIMRAKNGASKTTGQKTKLQSQLGLGKKIPTKGERNARKELVAKTLHDEKVKPMLEQFHKSPKRKDKNATDDS